MSTDYTSCTIRYKGCLIEVTMGDQIYAYEQVISGKSTIKIGEHLFYKMLKKKPHIRKLLNEQGEAMNGCSCGCSCC